jgi:hypothetical protein
MERKEWYDKFIWKEKVIGRLNKKNLELEEKYDKSTTLVEELYAKTI